MTPRPSSPLTMWCVRVRGIRSHWLSWHTISATKTQASVKYMADLPDRQEYMETAEQAFRDGTLKVVRVTVTEDEGQ